MFAAREQEKSCSSIVFALLRLIFSLQFSLLIANFSSFSKSHSTSVLSPSPRSKSGCFEKLPQMGRRQTHMLAFNSFEILCSCCYWDRLQPGSGAEDQPCGWRAWSTPPGLSRPDLDNREPSPGQGSWAVLPAQSCASTIPSVAGAAVTPTSRRGYRLGGWRDHGQGCTHR